MKVLLSAKVAVVRDDNVLLIRRAETAPSRPLGWDFPGGEVEANEDPKDTAVRETFEETGLVVDDLRVIDTRFVYSELDESNVLMVFFEAHTENSEVKLSLEHSEHQWVKIDDITSVEIPEILSQIVSLIDSA